MSLEHAVTHIKEAIDNQFKNYEDLSPEDQIRKHIDKVSEYMDEIAVQMSERGEQHDASKLSNEELPKWQKYIPALSKFRYGSKEYIEASKKMADVIKIHHKSNAHHPEFYKNGIKDMNLIDICEMCADWLAASERTNAGDINKSIDDNQERFKYSDDLKEILKNTVKLLKEDNE